MLGVSSLFANTCSKTLTPLFDRSVNDRIRDVDHLITLLIEEWLLFAQQIIDRAIKQSRSNVHVFDHVFANGEDTLSIGCDWTLLFGRVWSFVGECYNAWRVARVGNCFSSVLCLKCQYFCQSHFDFFKDLQSCFKMAVVNVRKISKMIWKNWPSCVKVSRVFSFIGTQCIEVYWRPVCLLSW